MNNEDISEVQALISGYLDGELDPDDEARVERLLKESEAFRREFEKMERLVAVTAQLRIETPPDEVWDTFLDGVYNRVERRTGWMLFIIGMAFVATACLYWYVKTDWGAWYVKTLFAVPVVGLFILFVSVLRQRLIVAKTDRYSREVKW